MSWSFFVPKEYWIQSPADIIKLTEFPHPFEFVKYPEYWKINYTPDGKNPMTHSFNLQTLPNNCGVALVHEISGYDEKAFDWIEKICRDSPYNYVMIGHTNKGIIQSLIDRGYTIDHVFKSRRSDNKCTLLIKEL